MKTNVEIGIAVAVLLVIIIAVWYYMSRDKSVTCSDSTACTVPPNVACIITTGNSGICGPVVCTADSQCTTGTYTKCDTATGSKTYGTCIVPPATTCTDSTGCTVTPNLACISGICGPVACTSNAQCTTGANTTCDVTSGSKTYGTCIAPPATTCTDSTGCTVTPNLACISGACGPVACSADAQCTTGANTTCDVTSGSTTYGTCIAPPSVACTDSTTCTTLPYNACVNKLCSQVQCTAANQATTCTTAPNTVCSTTAAGTATYGTCVSPSSVRRRRQKM